jgi:hypothetical protein
VAPEPLSQRPRANSVKRKEPEGPSFAEIAAGHNGQTIPVNVDETMVTEITTEITKVTTVCDNIAGEVNKLVADPAIIMVFTGIITALRGITDAQCKIVNAIQNSNAVPPPHPPY